MRRHPFRKSFGLFVLYSLLIIGIFVLQFRNESVVSKNTGLLSVSVAQTQQEDGTLSLKNSLQVSFKGISFTADESNPVRLVLADESTEESLVLLSYTQETPLSYTFQFTNDVSVTFAVSDTKSTASLSISATLPDNAAGLYVPYKPTSGFSVTEKTRTRRLLNSKNTAYALTAAKIEDQQIYFIGRVGSAYYALYNEKDEFNFANLDPSLLITHKSTYDANIKQFRENLVSSVQSAIQSSQTLSEKSVIAYVAELASQNRYAEAIASIPDSFKKGNKRTYLSATYFNTLESMYASLVMHNENLDEMISNAADSSSLSVFALEDLADFANIFSFDPKVRAVMALPARILSGEEPNVKVSQATGILRTYLHLAELHSTLADDLLPAIPACLDIIESSCALTDSSLTILEKDVPVSSLLALETGNALIQWGTFNSASEYIQAGYGIVNSVLSGNTLDAITLADAYPLLVQNPNYPHYALLHREGLSVIWAWTCADSVSYTRQGSAATLATKFAKNESHYMMVTGITPFAEIEIYGLSFHSDPRFEAYNSSGFIYRENQSALFLKSRHKAETELVRFTYR